MFGWFISNRNYLEKGDKMNTDLKMDKKVFFSTLWIVVMINVAMADIFGFMMDKMAGTAAPEIQVPQIGMLIFAIIMEIPIVMIFLSRILKYKANRWSNIIAGIITIVFIVAGGSLDMVYVFFAAVEIVCLGMIIWNAWKWIDEGKLTA